MTEIKVGETYQHDCSGVRVVINEVKGEFLVVYSENLVFSKSTIPMGVFNLEYTLVVGGKDD